MSWQPSPLTKITSDMKTYLYWKLTFLRDKPWCPLVSLIDWIRYEILFNEELYVE